MEDCAGWQPLRKFDVSRLIVLAFPEVSFGLLEIREGRQTDGSVLASAPGRSLRASEEGRPLGKTRPRFPRTACGRLRPSLRGSATECFSGNSAEPRRPYWRYGMQSECCEYWPGAQELGTNNEGSSSEIWNIRDACLIGCIGQPVRFRAAQRGRGPRHAVPLRSDVPERCPDLTLTYTSSNCSCLVPAPSIGLAS